MTSNARFGFGIAALIFGIDQLIKYIVTEPLGISYQGAVMELLPFFDLRFVPNIGVSLGLLPANSDAMRWGLVVMYFYWIWVSQLK